MEQNKLIETIDKKQYEKELVNIKKRINETYKKISYTVNS